MQTAYKKKIPRGILRFLVGFWCARGNSSYFYRIIAKHAFVRTALFAYSVMLCNRYPAIQVCKKCAKMCRRAKQSPMDKSTTGFMAGFRTSEQTPFDIEMRFTMNKLLSCRYNPVRGWHHSCHRLHRRGERVRQHPGTAGRAGLAVLQQALGVCPACAGWRDGALSFPWL